MRLLVDTHHDVTLVPNPVIQRNAQGSFVYLVNPDHSVALHPVNVGTTDGSVSEVTGLEPGAVVAADNFNRLTDGAKITIRPVGPMRGSPHTSSNRPDVTSKGAGKGSFQPGTPSTP